MQAMRVTQEAQYIVRRAREHDARVVTLGQLVFFSTDSGDAWLLDPEDALRYASPGPASQSRCILSKPRRTSPSSGIMSIAWTNTIHGR